MKINKTKTSNYNFMKSNAIAYDIQSTTKDIYYTVAPGDMGIRQKLASCNKTQLKAIAAELKTVQKRLSYILYGQY